MQHVLDANKESTRLQKYTESREAEPEIPVVCGWGRDGQLKNLSSAVDVADGIAAAELQDWCSAFTDNRDGL
jgi:hypothetical protein